MRISHSICILGIALLSACSTTNQRISEQQKLFNSYSATEKKLIRMGQVAVGFDQQQVRMALGKPSRESTITSASGKELVWEYRQLSADLGLGIGASTSGTSGAGIGVHTSSERSRLLKRIVFDRHTGRVFRIQSFD